MSRQLIHLDCPASDRYVKAFRATREFPYSPPKTPMFRPFSNHFYWLEACNSDRVADVAIVLHDMVIHSKQWQMHFGIDAYNPSRWVESPYNTFKIQKHLIEGFKTQARL
jgi:hypothetical protein